MKQNTCEFYSVVFFRRGGKTGNCPVHESPTSIDGQNTWLTNSSGWVDVAWYGYTARNLCSAFNPHSLNVKEASVEHGRQWFLTLNMSGIMKMKRGLWTQSVPPCIDNLHRTCCLVVYSVICFKFTSKVKTKVKSTVLQFTHIQNEVRNHSLLITLRWIYSYLLRSVNQIVCRIAAERNRNYYFTWHDHMCMI